MLQAQVAPALRAMGFKGSGRQYEIPNETHWALLGFQASAWSDRQELSFTVNLTVVSRDDWAEIHSAYPQLGEKPKANSGLPPIFTRVSGTGYWHERIGMVMPGRRDTWWEVAADGQTATVAEDVLGAIRNNALPAMRERIGDRDRSR